MAILRRLALTALIITLITTGFYSCSTVLPTATSYHQEVLRAEVKLTEEFISFNDSLLFLRVSHSDTELLVQVTTSEPAMIMRLLMMGVTLWADSTAGQQQRVGVVFPGAGPALRHRPPATDRQPRNQRESPDTLVFDPVPVFEMVQKRNKVFNYGDRAEFIEDDHMAQIYMDEDSKLHYVMQLPLDLFGISDPSGSRLSVGVVSEAPSMPMPQQDRQPPPGGIRGRPGYPPARDPGVRRQAIQPVEHWVIFILDQTLQDTPQD